MSNSELNTITADLENDVPVTSNQKSIRLGILFRALKAILFVTSAFVIISAFFVFNVYLVPQIQEISSQGRNKHSNDQELRKEKEYSKQIVTLKKDIQKLSTKFASLTPATSYLVINTTKNRFFLYRNKKMIRQGFCSSGSYTLLMTEEANKQWIFKTPKGRFRIQGKTTYPVWRRPDWSFVEEGLPIPSSNHPSRWEYGVLGDYALSIGDGYLIHGTIYKRFLGMPVTHGCIRLNDEDLEAIYKNLDFGAKVYIY